VGVDTALALHSNTKGKKLRERAMKKWQHKEMLRGSGIMEGIRTVQEPAGNGKNKAAETS